MKASHRRSPAHHRRRDRSISEERPRTKTYGDRRDSYTSDYSDDFEPDTKSRDNSPSLRKRNGNYRRRDPYSSDYSSTSQLHSSAASKKSIQSLGRRRGAKGTRKNDASRRPGWRTHSISKDAPSRRDPISSRLLSAKQRKIEEMQNELFETEQKLGKMQKENKLLKTLQHRQDKALRRFEDTESDLPRIIAQNYEDQRVLKMRLKKTQEAEKVLESKLRENNDEMQKMENVLRRLKKIVYDKNLGERSELSRQLNNTENNLEVAERKIKELEKKLELTTSSFTRQINSERQKHKETKETLNSLEDEYKDIKARLREKERALDVSNIYALRKKDSPEKSFISGSVRSTPRREKNAIVSSGTQTDLAIMPASSHDTRRQIVTDVGQDPRHAKKIQKDFTSDFIFSPREASPRPTIGNHVDTSQKLGSVTPTMNGLHSSAIDQTVQDQREGSGLPVFLTADSPKSSPSASFPKDDFGGEIQARKIPQADNLEPAALVFNSGEEEELRVKRELEEAEKKKKALEAQKQKASLLAKLREVEDDAGESLENLNALPSLKSTKPSTVVTYPKSKAELVKNLLGSDTDPVVENLHLGKPSLIQPKNKPEKELSFGGYAPSVGSTSSNRNSKAPRKPLQQPETENDNDEPLFDLNSGKQNKKSDLMSQLFGTQTKSKSTTTNGDVSSSDDFLFDANPGGKAKQPTGGKVTPRAKPVHSGYPWEKNVVTSGAKPQMNHENHLVRQKSVTSAASFHDEDIEELSL